MGGIRDVLEANVITLTVQRIVGTKDSTLGVLYVGKRAKCFTMEDEWRFPKIKGETRIPAGTYKLRLHDSPRFGARYEAKTGHRHLLLLEDVPGFTGILIHVGNTEKDTDGCILVGEAATVRDESIGSSWAAYKRVIVPIIRKMKGGKEARCHVIDER